MDSTRELPLLGNKTVIFPVLTSTFPPAWDTVRVPEPVLFVAALVALLLFPPIPDPATTSTVNPSLISSSPREGIAWPVHLMDPSAQYPFAQD